MATVIGADGVTHYVYTISGVRVEFPAKAYPSQIAMMDKVIRGLQRGQHCLLESPTGSGKTLALLCASLAWQRAEAEKVKKFNEEAELAARAKISIKLEAAERDAKGAGNQVGWTKVKPVDHVKSELVKGDLNDSEMSAYYSDDNSDDDFQPMKRTKMSTSPPPEKPVVRHRSAVQEPKEQQQQKQEEKWEKSVTPNELDALESPVTGDEQPFIQRKQKIPKIFFGTRTHKQITQVVKEFRRTVYCTTPMGVLASREHTCIHPEVSRSSNKNEGCKTLNDPRLARLKQQKGCMYRTRGGQKLKTQSQLRSYGFHSGWDIEDLVGLGRQLRACPYYATRDLMEQAHIIFSPYNYLIDPRVRQSMKIPINDNVIILDEAHNIEDSARESAGGTFSQEDFRMALNDCEKIGGQNKTMKAEIEKLARFSSYMMNWIDRQATGMTSVGIDREVNIMNGTEFVAALSLDGYGPESLVELKQMVDYIFTEQLESERMDKPEDQEPHLSTATQTVLEGFLMIMNLMLEDNQVHREDYRAVVVKTLQRKRNTATGASAFGKGNVLSQWTYALNLWCLNPAVVMKEVRCHTRSIIVTSGTLSPLASYQTELNIDFKLTLEANHVIPANRVWVGTISQGPKNTLLNGTFKTTGTFDYQDELGRLILAVCQTIPHGVLCFLPSYSLLEKLVARWQDTGLWQHLSTFKTMVCESRDSSAFEETLKSFYSAIGDSQRALNCSMDSSGEMADECPSKRNESPNGAFMMAVCRGKVSEGLDFTDNNARAVICVGIPFPNFKDTQVQLKREYNDKKSSSTSVLNGSEWYEIQAFRALNQALGRCIRHKADWGAIMLVDDRFAKMPRYVNQLSKWARSSIRHYNAFAPMMNSLKEFTETFVAEDAAAALQASQQSLLESQREALVPAVTSSPYFAKPKMEMQSPEVLCIESSDEEVNQHLSDDEENATNSSSRPMKEVVDATPVRTKKPFATLLGNSNRLSLSQRKLAAENGSKYFQVMNNTSEMPKSELDP